MENKLTHVIVGGGAAGFFAAIACAEQFPEHRVILLEKMRMTLAKVRISGGGRCNVTHACFDPALLVKNYPRGHQELRGPFSRFQPRDTIQWFDKRGVKLKAEDDGRMFPSTDSSETIIQCLVHEASRTGVEVWLEHGVLGIHPISKKFHLALTQEKRLECDRLLLATGSAANIYPLVKQLGHTIIPLVPSLFTFNIPDSPFLDLSGVSLPSVLIQLPECSFAQTGPLLFTHWGLSGPAVLKLSAWAARELHALNYMTDVLINWLPECTDQETHHILQMSKVKNGARQVSTEAPIAFQIPKQFWRRIVVLAGIHDEQRWATVSHKQQQSLFMQLRQTKLEMKGKTTYKQEFVTCGGVALEEVNWKTMESRRCPGLFFAGEILNIDGITGGFNFQNAWTTGWLAGHSMGIL